MAQGVEVADIFRRHGKDWRAAQQQALDRGQRRVMGAIEACRTDRLGGEDGGQGQYHAGCDCPVGRF